MRKRLVVVGILLILLFTNFSFNTYAGYLRNVPQLITQPDGSKIQCFATGDEIGRAHV